MMMRQMDKQHIPAGQQNLISLLEKNALRFFAFIIAVMSLSLLYFGPQIAPAFKELIIPIATSLLASLIFAIVYSTIVEQHHLAALNAELSHSVKEIVEDMKLLQEANMQQITESTIAKIDELERSHFHEISLHFREFIPIHSFPPSNEPDKKFNHTLNQSLFKSRHYLFKGVTGRYIPSRLVAAGHNNLTCKILLVDPAREDLLRLYIRDRFGATTSNEELARRMKNVKEEIYMTIVDLFQQGQRTNIDVKLYHGPVFYRTEILDEEIFISYFTAKTSTGYPTTYLYNRESFYYDAFLTDFNQTFELATVSATFNSLSREQDLADFLTRIGCDSGAIPHLRQEAEKFRIDFLKSIQ